MFGAKPVNAGYNPTVATAGNLATTQGFSFTSQSTGTPSIGGFTFGANKAGIVTTTSTGLTFGTATTTASASLGFNTAATTSTAPFKLTSSATAPGGFTFGNTTTTSATAPTGFGFGNTTTTSATAPTGFGFGNTTTTSATAPTGFGFGNTTTTSATAPGGISFGNITTTSATAPGGISFGNTTTTSATAPTGFGFGNTITTSASSTASALPLLSSALGTTTAVTQSTGLTFPGITTSTATSVGGSIFGSTPAKTQSTGLGGVDPQTSTATSSGSTADSKTGDGKTLKQSLLPPPMVQTVEDFQKYVKEEKSVQENVARMTCKPMYKVQEDVAALKQLLSVVSNGLHRNACSVEKLKQEMTQELKNAEMAQRTKDVPPGLQYENTAPTEYFQSLVDSFEHQMLTYRQQIETLEGHLASLHQSNKLSPDEIISLMRKLHEAFIALAAQLHQVHEAVKTQKEHYLNYRKIFLQDSKNIFEHEKKTPLQQKVPLAHVGPSPFTGMSSAAAMAMASALTKSQQPAAAPPVAGLGANTTGFGGTSLFGGLSGTTQSSGFGGFGTGGTTTTQSSATGGFFGGGAGTAPTIGFGSTQPANQSLFGSNPAVGTATPAFGVATPLPGAEAPFQLNKPPGKRGKR